jgi:hypothetical protein
MVTKPRSAGTMKLSHLPLISAQPEEPPSGVAPPLEETAEAVRVRNLALARDRLPGVFNEAHLPLPQTIHAQLLALGITGGEVNALIAWWVSRPEYKKARINRQIERNRQRYQLDDERIACRVAGLALLVDLAPDLFKYASPVPLAIGIDQQIAELGMERQTVSDVLSWWTRTSGYRAAVVKGGHRFNLDGSVAGEISAKDQAFSAEEKKCASAF